MKAVVAIGGGQLKNFGTLKIDEEIVRLSRKTSPKALFIPPPSRDVPYYWEIFQDVYGKRLHCKTNMLNLINNTPTQKEIHEKIFSSDIIYVGGGNTLYLMKKIRKLGLDTLLRKAYEQGIILSGISAGSICWFDYGLSNSQKFYNSDGWKYMRVKGLGFISAINCPHYHTERREAEFASTIEKYRGIGIALDDNCAIEFIDDTYRVLASQKGSRGYKIYKREDQIVSERLEHTSSFKKIDSLLSTPHTTQAA